VGDVRVLYGVESFHDQIADWRSSCYWVSVIIVLPGSLVPAYHHKRALSSQFGKVHVEEDIKSYASRSGLAVVV
jgi:hypothetical protein